MLLSLSNVSKSYGEKLILNELNATIEDNDRIGLIGANGIGKSTLLNILCRELQADTGNINYLTGIRIGFLKQNSGLSKQGTIIGEMKSVFSDLLDVEKEIRQLEKQIATMKESKHESKEYKDLLVEYSNKSHFFEHSGGYDIDYKIKMILSGMGFLDKDYDFNISSLSGGEKTRLALSKLLLEQPDLLVLDEPTNHLDFKTLAWLEDYLKEYKGGLLIVSHDRYFLDKMVTKVWDIENKKIISYKGNYTKFKQLREERYTRWLKEYEMQQLQIASMQDYIQKNIVRASTSNSAKSRVHQLANMDIIEKPVDYVKVPYFNFNVVKNPVKDVLQTFDLELSVGSGSDKIVLFSSLNLDIKRGEKVAIIGDNGVGKSTLLKSLLGYTAQKGEIVWGNNTKVSYYDQENSTLDVNKTVLDEVWDRFPHMQEYLVRKLLGSVLISDDNVYKKIDVISGGEKAKVGLAILKNEESNILVLDEPTNHLDLQSKESLENALKEYEGTLIFVSHDRYFLNEIPTKIIEMCKPNIVNIYKGNFDFYIEQKAIEQAKELEQKLEAQRNAPKQDNGDKKTSYRSKQQRSDDAKRRTRVKFLEEQIEQLDGDIKSAEQDIANPDNASNFDLLVEKCNLLEQLKKEHDDAVEEWFELTNEE